MVARKQYLLRIDPKVWAEVEKWAADDLRSVNAQVEYLLRDALRKRRGRKLPEIPEEEPVETGADGAESDGAGPPGEVAKPAREGD